MDQSVEIQSDINFLALQENHVVKEEIIVMVENDENSSEMSFAEDMVKRALEDENETKGKILGKNKIFKDNSYLQEMFLNVIDGKKHYCCLSCDKSYLRRYRLIEHFRTHTQEKPFICPKCMKPFSTKALLNRHSSVHNEKMDYMCDICGKSFRRKEHLIRHQKDHKGGHSRVPCPECGVTFSSNTHLKYHILETHTKDFGADDDIYTCEFCDKKFALLSKIKCHLMTHTKEKPYKCPHCDKSYSRSQHLRTHLLDHTGGTPFKCQVCYRGFKESGKLKKHMRVHTGDKPYKCPKCGKGFANSYNCRVHTKIHDRDTE